MKRKPKIVLPAKYILLILTVVCVAAMITSFTLNISGGPLNAVAGYVFVPMQRGINTVGAWITEKADNLKNLSDVMAENDALKKQVDELTSELNTNNLEQYELENLRELLALDQKYPSYEKVAANVIGKSSGNWFSYFTIDKGTDDGIEVDMNVIAGSGLVGIVTDVGPNYAKVTSIINDTAQVSGSVITFVVLYSSSVLNAVMTQEIMGITATKEKNTSDTYLKMIQIMAPAEYCFLRFFIYIAPFAAFFAALCSL